MKCHKARDQIAGMSVGALTPLQIKRLNNHLDRCESCRLVRRQHADLEDLLSSYVPPSLPADFSRELRNRLEFAARVDEAVPTGLFASARIMPWALGAVAILFLGALVGAASVYFFLPDRLADRQTKDATEPPSQKPSVQMAMSPTQTIPPASSLRPGEMVVIALEIQSNQEDPSAELELVLPDGLALMGPGRILYAEKELRIFKPMANGRHRVLLAVQALRSGIWTLVAKARIHGTDLTARTRIRVGQS